MYLTRTSTCQFHRLAERRTEHMDQPQALTREPASAAWTQVQQLISVGAYEERSAWHHETGTYPEDGVEESAVNLEAWAAKQGLEFCYNHDTSTWSLQPIDEPEDLVAEMHRRIDSPGYNELGEDEPLYHEPDDEDEEDGSGLHQCPYCYNLVNDEHEEFCRLNPNRNREVMP